MGSGSFLQEAVGGVLIAMPLKFPELLLLQGQHGVHLQTAREGLNARTDRPTELTALLPHHDGYTSHLHHSMADSPVGFLLPQKQQGQNYERTPSSSHDQQT